MGKLIIISWLGLLGWVITADYTTVVDSTTNVIDQIRYVRGAVIDRLPLGYEYSRKYRR